MTRKYAFFCILGGIKLETGQKEGRIMNWKKKIEGKKLEKKT